MAVAFCVIWDSRSGRRHSNENIDTRFDRLEKKIDENGQKSHTRMGRIEGALRRSAKMSKIWEQRFLTLSLP